ncbi:MAG: pilus (MSHA type) biogenesis protein MshL [Desulfobacteraceae bacterium 4572_187]|nr:MAG: pilus (MSHA type) biogenesis protein MshL [Desulfobacteraceae bacterium 4572_187]
MKSFKNLFSIIFIYFLAGFFLGGCSLGPSSVLEPKEPPIIPVPEKIHGESDKLAEIQRAFHDAIEKKASREIDIKPVMPAYDPLEDRIVSFSMINEDLRLILYSLSKAVGMNLIINPEVTVEEKRLTINFEKVSASKVLKEILNSFDLYYEIEGNVIRVSPYQEKMFRLNFLDTYIDTDFVVGGDVLGAGNQEGMEGLSGTFKLTGKGSEKGKGNPYDVIEDMVRRTISQGGKYSINRISGSLYVKDTPATIHMISRIINYAKEMLSRQILIEARIIEIILSDEYKYGIDWSVVRQDVDSKAKRIISTSWASEVGLAVQGIFRHFNVDATVDALNGFGDMKVVSNPTIRAKHGQPAIISVGTSISYTKSTETTTTGTGDNSNTTTDVEVSKVFDGLILGVIPFIEEGGKISLMINPIKSDVDRESLELISIGNQKITLPEVRIKEINTTIALNSGDVVILGGLIDKRLTTDNKGVPFLSAIPVLGYLFKNEFKSEESRELVIILSVSII